MTWTFARRCNPMDSDGIIDEIRASVDEGAQLSAVSSTDDQLVLVLGENGSRDRFRLDAEDTRNLLQADLVERLTGTDGERREALLTG